PYERTMPPYQNSESILVSRLREALKQMSITVRGIGGPARQSADKVEYTGESSFGHDLSRASRLFHQVMPSRRGARTFFP
ncbi:MAG: hypothetical protein ACRELG_30160, partial [Gemmataceae bacterium]